MKKIIIPIIVIALVAAFGAAYFMRSGGNTTPATSSGQSTASANAGEATISIAKAYPHAPSGSLLDIGTSRGTVQVKNFYVSGSAAVGEGGVVIIKQAAAYSLTYEPSSGSFWIAVSGSPFAAAREAAEQDFLATLGVSQSDACKLDVSIGVPYDPKNPLNGQTFPLGFCSVKQQY